MKNSSKHVWLTAAALAVVVVGASSPAAAQDAAKTEISGGYQYNRLMPSACTGSDCDINANGWYADVAGRVRPMLSLVGVVDGVYKKESGEWLKVHSYGGGIRIGSKRNSKVTPFGQVVVGGTTVSGDGDSTTAFTLTVGGGVNMAVNDRWGIRAQGDYRGIFFKEEDGDRVDGARVVVGAYFALGR